MIYSNLPTEIVRHVYEYDSTYHDEFKNNVLPCLDILTCFRLGNIHGLVVTLEKYMYKWKYKDCITKRKMIVIDKRFGVTATCVCGKIQCFNWDG